MSGRKIWLDDVRPAPDGWEWMKHAHDVNVALEAGGVEKVDLDHDLGDDRHGAETGYDVLTFIEARVFDGWAPPRIYIHTQNPVARDRMKAAVRAIYERAQIEDDGGSR